jgi:hypothetical protein
MRSSECHAFTRQAWAGSEAKDRASFTERRLFFSYFPDIASQLCYKGMR